MIHKLRHYRRIVGKRTIDNIRNSASGLEGKHISHLNATFFGGGVAELLNSLVILMNDLGMDVEWNILKGSQSFFNITKKFHNALHGENGKLTSFRKKIYLEESEKNSIMIHFRADDLVVIHDPQPLAMINYSKKKQPWIWRCHIDLSNPEKPIWNFLRPFVNKYDGVIFSMKKYKKRSIKPPQFIIPPSIDPLLPKNKNLSEKRCKRILSKGGIDIDKPVLSQISRFDKIKNPFGVIKIFEQVQKKADVMLILAGNMATDDPEGPVIYNKVMKKAEKNPGIKIVAGGTDLFINALQRQSSVILQNSKREGFALTVSEALWKKTPVVATRIGGIPLQVINGKTGFLIDNNREGAKRCLELLKNDKLRERIGERGREHVRKNFLITRHLQDYINLYNYYLK